MAEKRWTYLKKSNAKLALERKVCAFFVIPHRPQFKSWTSWKQLRTTCLEIRYCVLKTLEGPTLNRQCQPARRTEYERRYGKLLYKRVKWSGVLIAEGFQKKPAHLDANI